MVLMPDGHFGYGMPVGGVAAYRNQVSGEGVGFDIACGNAAILTDLKVDSLGDSKRKGKLADAINAAVSFGVGRSNKADDAPVDDPLFADPAWDVLAEVAGRQQRDTLHAKAIEQLGTVGSGNHYVDVFGDEQGRVWVGVHFGSRGLGHTIASGFYAMSQGEKWGARVRESHALFDLDSEVGDAYWQLMTLCGRATPMPAASGSRRKVVDIIGGREHDSSTPPNFAWRSSTRARSWWWCGRGRRRHSGQRGFVGGSMGDISVILEGSTSPAARDDQEAMLYSTVHGSGRVMGRQEAIRGRVARDAEGKPAGQRDVTTCVTPRMQKEWLSREGVVLRGGGVTSHRMLPAPACVLARWGQR